MPSAEKLLEQRKNVGYDRSEKSLTAKPIGVVGADGSIATYALEAFENSPRYQVVGLLDIKKTNWADDLIAAMPSLAGATVYRSLDEMLAHKDIFAVHVATPGDVRPSILEPVLQAKKHGMGEKPLVHTMEQLDRLEKVAAENNVTLFTLYHAMYGLAVLALADELEMTREGLVHVAYGPVEEVLQERYDLYIVDGKLKSSPREGSALLDGGPNVISQNWRYCRDQFYLEEAGYLSPDFEKGDYKDVHVQMIFRAGKTKIVTRIGWDPQWATLNAYGRNNVKSTQIRCEGGNTVEIAEVPGYYVVNNTIDWDFNEEAGGTRMSHEYAIAVEDAWRRQVGAIRQDHNGRLTRKITGVLYEARKMAEANTH